MNSDQITLGIGEILGTNLHLGSLGASVLFIGGQPGPTQGADAAVMAHLVARFGATEVEYLQASAATTADMDGRKLGVLSSTPSSSAMRGKWDQSPVPIMNWEEALMKNSNGDFRMGTSTAKPVTTTINVVDAAHPIMVDAGLAAGNHVIGGNDERNCPNGTLASGLQGIAELPSDANCKILALFDDGALDLQNNPVPARRSTFPLTDSSFNGLNATGLQLFDSTISWLLGLLDEIRILLQENGFSLLQENGAALLLES